MRKELLVVVGVLSLPGKALERLAMHPGALVRARHGDVNDADRHVQLVAQEASKTDRDIQASITALLVRMVQGA